MSAVQTVAAPVATTPGVIRLSGIGHTFERADGSDVEVLRDVDLTIEPGEVVSFVGRSGCGKSTLLNIIAGLLTPTAGAVEMSGEGRRALGRFDTELPTRAYITQENRLLPWRSAQQNVALPLELHGVGRADRAKAAQEILARVGLAGSEKRRPAELSGGQQQRVAIAQSLVFDPLVLLMDEPFGALDAWTRQSLHELVVDVHDEFGTTTVLVTHDVFEALSLSDRVVTLASHPGRVINDFRVPASARPRPHQSLQEPQFLELYEAILADLQIR